MDGRELESKLNYIGMSRGVRKIALDDKLASAEELAVMSEVEVCDLVAQNYQLVYSMERKKPIARNGNATGRKGFRMTVKTVHSSTGILRI